MSIVLGLYKFESPLEDINPDCGYEDWIRVGRAIYHATEGSDYGLVVFDRWSSKGDKYKGIKEIKAIWDSFSTDEKDPYPVGTLVIMAAEALGYEPEVYQQLCQQSMRDSFPPRYQPYTPDESE